MNAIPPTRILVLGGGFGGVYTALTLEKILKRELGRGEVEIALVSRDNYLTFQPMLPEVVSGSIGISTPSRPSDVSARAPISTRGPSKRSI
jgi:NADH dehydrogenase FAD-containing subunit